MLFIYSEYRLDKMKQKSERKYDLMQSKIIFVVLFMLSFSVFHDLFISLIEKDEHTNIVHYMSDEAPSPECAEFNEMHSMFHFMAIVTTYTNTQIQLAKIESIPHLLLQYTSPFEKTSYKPPIV